MNEAYEISTEDLEAASELYDNLCEKTHYSNNHLLPWDYIPKYSHGIEAYTGAKRKSWLIVMIRGYEHELNEHGISLVDMPEQVLTSRLNRLWTKVLEQRNP